MSDTMLNKPDTPDYAEVPADYPYHPMHGAVSGYQPKLLLTSSANGKFYSPGNAPHERWHDWNYSTALASAMTQKCLESKAGKRGTHERSRNHLAVLPTGGQSERSIWHRGAAQVGVHAGSERFSLAASRGLPADGWPEH